MLLTGERGARLLLHLSTQHSRCITRPSDYVALESGCCHVTPKDGRGAHSRENLIRASLQGGGRTALAAAQLGTCRNRVWEHSPPQNQHNADPQEKARYCFHHRTYSHLGSPFIFTGFGKRSLSGAGDCRSPSRELHPSGLSLFLPAPRRVYFTRHNAWRKTPIHASPAQGASTARTATDRTTTHLHRMFPKLPGAGIPESGE